MKNQEELAKLFFELASDNRLCILTELLGEALKMQEIARRLDVTATEAFRQLERLSAAMLVQRQPDGAYTVTSYGKLVLQLSSPLSFLLKHKQYFSAHDISQLPHKFISRLGELSGATLIMDTMESLNRGQRMFMMTEQFGWGLAEGVVPELMAPVMEERMQRGMKFRFLIPESKLPPTSPGLANMELRGLAEIPAVVAVTEKEAALCLRTFDGKIDYSAFYGTDPAFICWAKDFFLYFWEKGKRL